MQQIKKTKSVYMDGDENSIYLEIKVNGLVEHILIPAKVVFQVLRGLVSYNQKFYRKHIK